MFVNKETTYLLTYLFTYLLACFIVWDCAVAKRWTVMQENCPESERGTLFNNNNNNNNKKPVGLVRQDGKRPDGHTLIPFEGGRSLTWDVTVVCSTADSYIDLSVQGPGCVAEMAASRKEAKYATLQSHYDLQPIAVETLGLINESATSFLYD